MGYLASFDRTIVRMSNASVANINFQLPKANALIYGSIKDDLGRSLMGFEVIGDDPSFTHESSGVSGFPDASYSVGLLANFAPGTSSLEIDRFACLGLAGADTNVMVTPGQATNVNLVVPHANFPSLSAPTRPSNSQFRFLLNGLAAHTYVVEASTNLSDRNWFCIAVTNLSSTSATIIDSQATSRARFYRALFGP